MRLPLKSAKLAIPDVVLTKSPSQTNALAGMIGSAAHCQRLPLARSRVMRYSDSDISNMSNSSFLRLRKKSSGGVVTVMLRSSRGDVTLFSTSGSNRGFLVTPILSGNIGVLACIFILHTTSERRTQAVFVAASFLAHALA